MHAKQVIMMAEISNNTPLNTDSDPSDSENDSDSSGEYMWCSGRFRERLKQHTDNTIQ